MSWFSYKINILIYEYFQPPEEVFIYFITIVYILADVCGFFISMNIETWKDIIWFNGTYSISSLWKIKNNLTNKELNPYTQSTWYFQIDLRWKLFLIHRLIAIAFIPNPDNKPYINHIDWDRKNNILSNLEWCTQSENIKHYFNTKKNNT